MDNINPLVFDVAIFDPNKEELQKIVLEVANINVDPTKITREELELVNSTKNKLVKARTRIQEIGKEKRADALKFQKDVIAYENSLIAIIEPEELRLKAIEKDAKEYAIKEERKLKLPEYKQQLASIGDDFAITDDELLGMDPTQFQMYYNQRLGAHLEAKKAEAEAEEKARVEAKAKEQAETEAKQKAEADKLAREKEDIARREKELADQKINLRINSLLELGLRFDGEQYVLDDINVAIVEIKTLDDVQYSALVAKLKTEIERRNKDKEAKSEEKRLADIKEAEEKARLETEEKAKQEADAKEAKRLADEAAEQAKIKEEKEKEAAEKATREAQESYQKWLLENSYNPETDKIIELNGTGGHQYILYRTVSTYKPQ